ARSRSVCGVSSLLGTGVSVGSGAPPPIVGALARKSVAYGRSGTRVSPARAVGARTSRALGIRHWGGPPPVSNAVSDFADPVAKIGDIAAAAGVRRIHVLAWRDLDDVEAGGSEVHIAEVAKLWAAAGLEVTMRTSWAQGQPTEAVRDGYRVIRRAGRHMVFPRAALAEITGRTGPRDVLVEIWNGMPSLSPLWNRGPRVVLLHHVHAEMWNMTLGDTLGRLGALFESKVAPPLYRSSAIATLCESSKRELVEEL